MHSVTHGAELASMVLDQFAGKIADLASETMGRSVPSPLHMVEELDMYYGKKISAKETTLN